MLVRDSEKKDNLKRSMREGERDRREKYLAASDSAFSGISFLSVFSMTLKTLGPTCVHVGSIL